MVELGRCADHAPFDILMAAPPIEDMLPTQIAKAIRGSDLKRTKLLYVAPFEDAQDRIVHMKAGFDDVIAKPFSKRELFNVVQRLAGLCTMTISTVPTILIVEDNPVNAQVALFQVRKLGFQADIVTNGAEAVAAVAERNYAGVLMDMQMPVMDGIEATRRIRAYEQQSGDCKHIPIIALTTNPEFEREARAAGCNGFLTKPATIKDVGNALALCAVAV